MICLSAAYIAAMSLTMICLATIYLIEIYSGIICSDVTYLGVFYLFILKILFLNTFWKSSIKFGAIEKKDHPLGE